MDHTPDKPEALVLPAPPRPPRQGRSERLALVAGALLMMLIVASSALIAARTQARLADAEQAQRARLLSSQLLGYVLQAETGQRGLLVTGRADYLDDYNEAAPKVEQTLAALDASLGLRAPFPPWRTALGAAVADKMRELANTVQLGREGRLADAQSIVLSDRGRLDMKAVRALNERVTEWMRLRLIADLQASRGGARNLVAVDATALLLLVVLIVFVWKRLQTGMRALEKSEIDLRGANAELQQASARLESAVAERTAELSNANEEIQRFAYIVSHDLRAPLLNIIGFTGELQNATERLNRFVGEHLLQTGVAAPPDVVQASREDLPEAIRFIQSSTTKMDRLITAILRLSREGRRVLVPETLDMTELIGAIVDSVRHQADAAGAVVTVTKLPRLRSDRTAIEQVFSNLIENALKYLSPARPGRITISGERAGAFLRYRVEDNGRGIAERDRERIFELFRRAGSQEVPGEGIGLAHVRALLRRLGGTVACESRLDQGSEFIVTLPSRLSQTGAQSE